MSRSLERLRDTFGDELLIRRGRSYERTVRGERLLRELENLLPRLEALVRGEPFDPAQSRERLRVAMTDNGFIVLLPDITLEIGEKKLGRIRADYQVGRNGAANAAR